MMYDKFTTVPAIAITVCVEFADILEFTLPYNRHQFERFLVVTHPEDESTIETAKLHGAEVLLTEVFFSRGAKFNKWAALQQGLDFLSHIGWICILDADIAIPQQVYKQIEPKEGCLYTPRRLSCLDISRGVPPEKHWKRYKPVNLKEDFHGYFQLFHTQDPVLSERPWFRRDWSWAGTADVIFANRWKDANKLRAPWDVMHLGTAQKNWCGRTQPYVDGRQPTNVFQRQQDSSVLLRQQRLNQGLDDRYKGVRLPGDNQ